MNAVEAAVTGIARHESPYAELEELDSCTITEESGLEGDYRGLHSDDDARVVVLFANQWREVCDEIGEKFPWTTRRANILLDGIANPRASKSRLTIGEVELETSRECEPCSRMDRQRPGLRTALSVGWRGGICCRVLRGGGVTIGDSAQVCASEELRSGPPDELAGEVLRFWFEETSPKKWFEKDPEFDKAIREKFETTRDLALTGKYDHWSRCSEGAVALVIVLDQFSRNLFRMDGRAFEADLKAREVAVQAIEAGFDRELPEARRAFLYLPFMHSESLEDQDRCVLFIRERLEDNEEGVYHALQHRELIRRFGRFPYRNHALGRESTPEEREFLASGGYSP
jgi:uncharacterized protein (DUF924 family)/MOSC domain-containing protein YiiM